MDDPSETEEKTGSSKGRKIWTALAVLVVIGLVCLLALLVVLPFAAGAFFTAVLIEPDLIAKTTTLPVLEAKLELRPGVRGRIDVEAWGGSWSPNVSEARLVLGGPRPDLPGFLEARFEARQAPDLESGREYRAFRATATFPVDRRSFRGLVMESTFGESLFPLEARRLLPDEIQMDGVMLRPGKVPSLRVRAQVPGTGWTPGTIRQHFKIQEDGEVRGNWPPRPWRPRLLEGDSRFVFVAGRGGRDDSGEEVRAICEKFPVHPNAKLHFHTDDGSVLYEPAGGGRYRRKAATDPSGKVSSETKQ